MSSKVYILCYGSYPVIRKHGILNREYADMNEGMFTVTVDEEKKDLKIKELMDSGIKIKDIHSDKTLDRLSKLFNQ